MDTARSQDPRPLVVWSCPRTLSHAFEKMIRARGDHIIFPEPFNEPWFFGPERQTHRTELPQNSTLTFNGELKKILDASHEGRVYVRAHACQLGRYFTRDVLSKFQPAVQIRDPAYALPSLYKLKPDFSEDEAGFKELRDAWKMHLDMGESVPVVDAIDLQRDPVTTVGLWCDAVGIQRKPEALSWRPGYEDGWGRWEEYTKDVSETCAFLPPPTKFPDVPNERVAKLIDSFRVYYREMEAHKLSS